MKTIFYYSIANWLSERRFFWDFIRPACIGSCRQSSKNMLKKITFIFFSSVIERVEEVSNTRNLRDKVCYK
jgi:hypothetical protein